MKLIETYDQHRRDCYMDIECEKCGEKETGVRAYDDSNYWVNVLPNRKCKKCSESTKSLGIEPESIATRYPEGFQI